MAEAKSIVKQQLQAMTEMKERVDKYGHLLDPEDQAFLSEQVAQSLRKCKLYMDMEEKITAADKAKKEADKKEKIAAANKTATEPAKKEEPAKAEEAPKKKAAPKKKKEDVQVPLIPEEEQAKEEAKASEPTPEPVLEPVSEPNPAMEPVPEEDLSLDDLLG